MNIEKVQSNLAGIKEVISSLHDEMMSLEAAYLDVLRKLEKFQEENGRDDLTGLLRRKPFFEKWNRLIQHCQELQQESGVLIIDIDHFKSVNDTYGHATGDEVIQRVSSLLRQFETSTCFTGRLGGEEFAMVYQGSPEEVEALAEQVRLEVAQLQCDVRNSSGLTSHQKLSCTVSIGVAHVGMDSPGGVSPTDVLHQADLALYAAKKGGRNQVRRAA